MSKLIKMTQEMIDTCKKEFEEAIAKTNLFDGKLSFTKQFDQSNEKANLYFMPDAYTKMVLLVRNFDKEVAWHGTAIRGDGNDYFVTDIIVYPQEVTGATVTTDQVEYERWLLNLDDDVFNALRFQGHSHVNMGVSPSGVDTADQSKIVDQLKDDMFYIFFIMNKSFNTYAKIYDMQKNIMFEDKDITCQMYTGGIDMQSFLKDAKSIVKEKSYTSAGSYAGSTYANNTYYNGYGAQQNKSNIVPIVQSNKKEDKKDTKENDTTKDTKKDNKSSDLSKKKKTKANDKVTHAPKNSSGAKNDPYDEYGYWAYGDSYYDPFYYNDGYMRGEK